MILFMPSFYVYLSVRQQRAYVIKKGDGARSTERIDSWAVLGSRGCTLMPTYFVRNTWEAYPRWGNRERAGGVAHLSPDCLYGLRGMPQEGKQGTDRWVRTFEPKHFVQISWEACPWWGNRGQTYGVALF